MCGRFALARLDDKFVKSWGVVLGNDLPEVPNYNICPTDLVHTVVSADGVRHLRAMRWGFIPSWYKSPTGGPLHINARSDTLAEKSTFRAACRERRCLIPATGFYEWTKDEDGRRLPWYISPTDGGLIAFGGIWQEWERDGERHTTCAIVTTDASETMSAIHHRMPLSLAPEQWPLWLGEAGHGAARLMQPAPENRFRFHRVDPAVNSNRASGADLIEPLED